MVFDEEDGGGGRLHTFKSLQPPGFTPWPGGTSFGRGGPRRATDGAYRPAAGLAADRAPAAPADLRAAGRAGRRRLRNREPHRLAPRRASAHPPPGRQHVDDLQPATTRVG